MNRETWLNEMAARMAPRFAELGHPLPAFRVSVGFTSAGKDSNAIGECWNKSTSADACFEIFIRPDQADSMTVAATLAHELTHSAVGFAEGHKGAFAVVALALGLQRPMTATTAGPAFIAWVQPFIDALGPIPHAALTWRQAETRRPSVARGAAGVAFVPAPEPEQEPEGGQPAGGVSSAPPKQSARLLKVACEACGYTVRVTAKWLDVGAPHCPVHGAMAAC